MDVQDFTDREQKLTSSLLLERYGRFVPLQLADSELQFGSILVTSAFARPSTGANAARILLYAKPGNGGIATSSSIPRPANMALATTNMTNWKPASSLYCRYSRIMNGSLQIFLRELPPPVLEIQITMAH